MDDINGAVLETARLRLRRLRPDDFGNLCLILQDAEAMYAYEHAFSDREVREWLDKQLGNYERYGFGLWAVELRGSGEFIGQCGLTMQGTPRGERLEVGYLFCRAHWHRGYATEAAAACMDYAFGALGADEVCSIIRENNLASRAVAERNGLVPEGRFTKHYYGVDMPHIVYVKRKKF